MVERWIIVSFVLFPFIWLPVQNTFKILGIFRPLSGIGNIHGTGLQKIPNTMQCEDLQWHKPSGLLYSVCADDHPEYRWQWYPPVANFKDPKALPSGSIYVIDPETLTSKRLNLRGFNTPFVTHGIDVVSSGIPNIVNIYAINHLPNPDYDPNDPDSNKARSQIELFRYTVGADEAEHWRTIRHPLIRTPNDILAVSPTSMYVTNDFSYREGRMRKLEQIAGGYVRIHSDVVFVDIRDPKASVPEAAVNGSVAFELATPNGLGRGSETLPDQFLVNSFMGGTVYRVKRKTEKGASPELTVTHSLKVECPVDNPTWYHDPYATAENNATGYILGGFARVVDFESFIASEGKTRCPGMVWHGKAEGAPEFDFFKPRLIFQDDGESISGVTTAVMLPVDPARNGGKKQGRLFVTSVFSDNILTTLIDL